MATTVADLIRAIRPFSDAWNRARETTSSLRLSVIGDAAKSHITATHILNANIALAVAEALPSDDGWMPIETAPKDEPILAWCDHKADPYVADHKTGRLTTFGAHCEGLGRGPDGIHVVEWGGEYHDSDDGYTPAWWFLTRTDFESPVNPTHWRPLPPPPTGDKE